MNRTSFILPIVVITGLLAAAAFGQRTLPQPRQEKLLNGLRVLLWSDASDKNVEIRLRVHSGAAFDPQGKEGVMKLLAEDIFPNEAARDYFRDDLGGGLEIVTTYDYIQINASGKPEYFLQMLETLSTAVANPTIDKETTAKLRTALLATVKQLEADPAYVADQAVAKRLFGTFPYGRPTYGSPESIAKVDFADLIDAKQRFLTADNATVAISGNYDKSIGLRAVRRLFGAWLKSDKRVPSTFRQPDPPSVGVQLVASPSTDVSAIRFAARGIARKDKDFAAARVFAAVLEGRLKSRVPGDHAGDIFVRSEEHTLPGIIIIGFSAKRASADDSKIEAEKLLVNSLAEPVTDAEFGAARSRFAAEWSKKDPVSFWLDADTYGMPNVAPDTTTADNVTLADVNAFADKFRKSPMAAVLVNTPPTAN